MAGTGVIFIVIASVELLLLQALTFGLIVKMGQASLEAVFGTVERDTLVLIVSVSGKKEYLQSNL